MSAVSASVGRTGPGLAQFGSEGAADRRSHGKRIFSVLTFTSF